MDHVTRNLRLERRELFLLKAGELVAVVAEVTREGAEVEVATEEPEELLEVEPVRCSPVASVGVGVEGGGKSTRSLIEALESILLCTYAFIKVSYRSRSRREKKNLRRSWTQLVNETISSGEVTTWT